MNQEKLKEFAEWLEAEEQRLVRNTSEMSRSQRNKYANLGTVANSMLNIAEKIHAVAKYVRGKINVD